MIYALNQATKRVFLWIRAFFVVAIPCNMHDSDITVNVSGDIKLAAMVFVWSSCVCSFQYIRIKSVVIASKIIGFETIFTRCLSCRSEFCLWSEPFFVLTPFNLFLIIASDTRNFQNKYRINDHSESVRIMMHVWRNLNCVVIFCFRRIIIFRGFHVMDEMEIMSCLKMSPNIHRSAECTINDVPF